MDPKLTWCAGKANYWFQPHPGTDAALALGMSHIIVIEGLQDQNFIDRWTYGYEVRAESLEKYTPGNVSQICGVSAEKIINAARDLTAAPSTCLQWDVAFDHTSEGFIGGLVCFNPLAVTGNFKKLVLWFQRVPFWCWRNMDA